jgi:SAM-dependent methyltransferase
MAASWRDADAFLAEEFDFLAESTAAERFDSLPPDLPERRDRALDVGCGTGILAMRLAEQFRRVVGLDISASMIAVANRRRRAQRRHNVDFVLADMTALPCPAASFDYVVSTAAIHRVRVGEALTALHRLVRPGGILVVVSLVSVRPRLDACPLVQVAGALRSIPAYLRSHGPAATWRIVRFRTSPAWLRLHATVRIPTPDDFREACARILPGCTFRATSPWTLASVWRAPR